MQIAAGNLIETRKKVEELSTKNGKVKLSNPILNKLQR